MRIQESELLGDSIGLQSIMQPGNHKLVVCGVLSAEAKFNIALSEVFASDHRFLLAYIRRLEGEQLLRYTNGLLPEDLGFTPEATEIKLYRSGVTQGLPCLERMMSQEGITMEAAVEQLEHAANVLREKLRLLKFDVEATQQLVEGFTWEDHRNMDAVYLRLRRYEARQQRVS